MPRSRNPIRFFRGNEADIPAGFDGEPIWTMDTHKLLIYQDGVAYLINSEGSSDDDTSLWLDSYGGW